MERYLFLSSSSDPLVVARFAPSNQSLDSQAHFCQDVALSFGNPPFRCDIFN